MKQIRQFLTVIAAALLLVMAFLLIVPLPLSWWLPYTEAENAVWSCAVKVNEDRPLTELDETDAKEFAEVLEQTKVRFRGWSENYMLFPYIQLFQLDAESGKRSSDTCTFSFDEQGLLVVDEVQHLSLAKGGSDAILYWSDSIFLPHSSHVDLTH